MAKARGRAAPGEPGGPRRGSRPGRNGRSQPAAATLTRAEDATILEARIVFRPHLSDLYVRIDLERVSRTGGDPTLLYGAELVVDGVRYEVRAQAAGGDAAPVLDPVFGLFECPDDNPSREIAKLRGGWGTAGEAVVTAVPVHLVGTATQPRLDGFGVFAATGTYDQGGVDLLDRLLSTDSE